MKLSQQQRQLALQLGFTAVLVGYLAVWLPGPAAGLQFIGLELGEWIKFLGVGPRRDLFYLPPITLGLALMFWTVGWSNGRWQTWMMRGVGMGVSLLAFPAIQVISSEPQSEWLLRLVLIALVGLGLLASTLLSTRQQRPTPRWCWAVLASLGLIGLCLPTWQYSAVRPLVAQVLGLPVGIGPGVWLNGIGHVLIGAIGFHEWLAPKGKALVNQAPED
jgi:hypothetical protein